MGLEVGVARVKLQLGKQRQRKIKPVPSSVWQKAAAARLGGPQHDGSFQTEPVFLSLNRVF